MGAKEKKLQKEKERYKVTEMPEGNIEERLDNGRRILLCVREIRRTMMSHGHRKLLLRIILIFRNYDIINTRRKLLYFL